MRRKISTKMALGLFAILAAAVAGYVYGAPPRRPAYTIEWRDLAHKGGESREVGRETVRSHADGRKLFIRAANGESGEQRHSPRPDVRTATARELRESSQFSHTDMLLGYEAYVMKVSDTVEAWRLPALGGDVAKIVIRDKAGELVQTTEPVSITLGEPAELQQK